MSTVFEQYGTYPAVLVDLCRQWASADPNDLAYRWAVYDAFVEAGWEIEAQNHFQRTTNGLFVGCTPSGDCSLITHILTHRED